MSDAMKITITISFKDGGEPSAEAQIVDLPATEIVAEPRRALPPPRRRWLRPNLFDGAVIAGALAIWWLLS
jgi:hypothetical protein